MKKTVGIDYSSDRLISMAAEYAEEHEYLKAIKMLNKNAALNDNDEDSYMLYAEIFDDMGLTEKSINCWLKYLDCASDGASLAEAYESLAISLMHVGRESFSSYYYTKLVESGEVTLEGTKEMLNALIKNFDTGIRAVWPPKAADYTLELENGVNLMRENKFSDAIKKFSCVKKGSQSYNVARNYIAMCYILNDEYDEAEKECLKILKKTPDDVFAMSNLSAVLVQQHRFDEAKEYTKHLLTIETDNEDDLYKIATVCCENKMHKEAYNLFKRIEGSDNYDSNFLFFKGIAAYNCNKIEEALDIFDTLLTIYPHAITAAYWLSIIREEGNKPAEERRELEYYYRLPKEVCKDNIAILEAFVNLSESEASKVADEEPAILTAILWCFDEGDISPNVQLKALGAKAALAAGYEDLAEDVMLDCFAPENVKLAVLADLIAKYNGGEFNIVYYNLFREVFAHPIKVGRKKRKLFLNAYGIVFAHFGIIKEQQRIMIVSAMEEVYKKFEKAGKLDDIKSAEELVALISCIVEVGGSTTKEMVCKMFNVKTQRVNALLKEYSDMVGAEDEDEDI